MKNLIIPALALILFGCGKSNKLDNEIALNILKSEYKESCLNEVDDYIFSNDRHISYKTWERYYSELESYGLVRLKRKKYRSGTSGIQLIPTNKAKQEYEVGPGFASFVAAVLKFEVTDIVGISHQEDGNKAEVIFKGNLQQTPFYNVMTKKKNCKIQYGVERKATFVKFDTGWRLQ